MSERGVVVYIIGPAAGPFKVGTAKNVQKRLRALQGANPHELVVHHTTGGMLRIIAEQIEFETHHRLRETHLHGEWFSCALEHAQAAIAEAAIYVRNRRSNGSHQTHVKISRNLRTAKPYRGNGGDWLA